ncbi:MAG: hypothetical protein JNL18_22750 [Planctomycetaceae bacterium]|nr:hypothetical protein [Planctomycetaceae bacterium]
MLNIFDQQTTSLTAQLPPAPRIAVIGSTSFWHPDSATTCQLIGAQLAQIDRLILLTGGVSGVGESVGRSFFAACGSGEQRTFHVLPAGCVPWDYGVTLFAGRNMEERREVLGRMAPIYLVIEGGPGTAHEHQVASKRGATIIPIGRTEGHAGAIYPHTPKPPAAAQSDWDALGTAGPAEIATAVVSIIRAIIAVGE